jgi:sulfate adenylyltransferase subunit 2
MKGESGSMKSTQAATLTSPPSPGGAWAPWDHLDRLESEAIHILREVAAQCARPVLLFSGGKDSMVVLHLARKAFYPQRLPFPLMHVDTGHNFPEVIEFRDQVVKSLGVDLIVRSVEESIRQGRARVRFETDSRNALQAVTLVDAIHEFGFDACLGGARRDEEKARAKERIFSFRDEFGGWDPKNQRPELWDLYNAHVHPGENMRVFPISNWTEADVWEYIARERLDLPSLYFAHRREVVARGDQWIPVTPLTPPRVGEQVEERWVRFRTVGDMTCTCPVPSEARTLEDILRETATSTLTERGATRTDDQTSEASMELRKKQGYF